ncbi:MAG TPA: hypothetical protein VFS39_04130 [Nitrospira sp.]|nr:hypothetical protein [Nitrospira sp.]
MTRTAAVFLMVLLLASVSLADDGAAPAQTEEPMLFDYYVGLQAMQQRMAQQPLEEQDRLRPQMHQAEQAACRRLWKDRRDAVPRETYQEQGGAQFDAFVLQFERYCDFLLK